MALITIRQTADLTASPNATVSFNGEPGIAVTVSDPFSAAEEKRLAWYFEEWLKFPFTDGVKATDAAASVRVYGEALFAQTLRGNDHLYSRYRQAVQTGGVAALGFQIVGDPAFHRLHWEALWDPDRPHQPLTLDATMIRSTVQPVINPVTVQPSATINLLLVTARPHGKRDVAYRTIQRPLIEMLRRSQLPVTVDVVRPGTWRALVDHLHAARRQHGIGHYQIIHFDLHGAVMGRSALAKIEGVSRHSYRVRLHDRYARPDLAAAAPDNSADARPTAWLFFEDETNDDLDAASAQEVAGLLLENGIPIAILNACQSGQETGDPETSLGSRLLQAGVQTVVAMGYSVTVAGATRFMEHFYRALFQPPHDLLAALAAGRTALHHEKQRNARFNQTIPLEDWLLPVLYQPSSQIPRQLPLREMDFTEQIAFFARLTERYAAPDPEYGFVGRDLDILQIEKRLLQQDEGKRRNLLLIQGMGGAGKTTLLHHLAGWWQQTGLIGEVFYFGYDRKAYHLQALLQSIAGRLLNRNIPAGATVSKEFSAFQAMQPPVQAKLLAQKLRSERHLLILDNLESVTGDPLAIPNTLPLAEQIALRAFLADLLDGATLVLLGSRGTTPWLRQGTPSPSPFPARGEGGTTPPLRAGEAGRGSAPLREVDIYPLPGLDTGAASDLAERILRRQVVDPKKRATYLADPAFARLITLLDGSPLALEVVLSNLAQQTPREIITALAAADPVLDRHRPTTAVLSGEGANAATDIGERRTQSILACIAYSHSNLAPAAQRFLLSLSPFTGVLWAEQLPAYAERLAAAAPDHFGNAPALAAETLDAAREWGLLTPHELPGYVHIQPVLAYFLKSRLDPKFVALIEMSFYQYYSEHGRTFSAAIESRDPAERQTGLTLTQLEFENLTTALHIALASHMPFYDVYRPLHLYLKSIQATKQRVALGEMIRTKKADYSASQLTDDTIEDFYIALDWLAGAYLDLRDYQSAQQLYQETLELLESIQHFSAERKGKSEAITYHQLGVVAQAQRQWAQAEAHYGQALALQIEFNDRYSQASTYHQLGVVAQAQRQWAQAEAHYGQALELQIEFNDRYSQARTYHQLGVVAREQRQWAQAEAHYGQALELKIEFNDRYSQARTYHNLGVVAQEQRQWAQAEAHYGQALALFIEFNDRYSQASTYGQLGLLAEAQDDWTQAGTYLVQALQIFAEFQDQHSTEIAIRSLARLHRAGGAGDLPAAVAGVLGVPVAEVEGLFARAVGEDEAA